MQTLNCPISVKQAHGPATALRFLRLKIAYSWKCNARCEHCSVSSGPEQNEKINRQVVLQCIEDAASTGLRWIEFTGGEIFIFLSDLRTFMEKSHSLGLKVGLDTNAFWAKDKEKAKSLLADLRNKGLSRISFSTDQYHARYIEPSRVLNAITAARELGIECWVTVCVMRNDLKALEFISLLRQYTPNIQTQSVAPFGRARQIDSRMMVKCSFERAGIRCEAVTGPLLSPDGRVTLCCAPPAQFPERTARFSPLVLGRIDQEPLRDILRRAQADPLLNLFVAEGMGGLIKRLNAMTPNRYRPRTGGYFGVCDLCTEVFGSPQIVRDLRRLAQQAFAEGGHEIT